MRVRSSLSLTFLFIYIICTGGRNPYSLTAVTFPRLVLKVRTRYDSIMVEVKLLYFLVLNPGEKGKKLEVVLNRYSDICTSAVFGSGRGFGVIPGSRIL